MVYKARLLLSGRQKIALALLLAAVIVFLAYYPRITEGLLAFLLGGVVPGTNIIISPDIVILLVLGLFFVGTISLVLRMYLKAARGKRNFRIAVQAIESVAVLPVARDVFIDTDPATGVQASAAVHKRHAIAMFMKMFSGNLRRVAVIVAGAIGRTLHAAGGSVWGAVRFTARWIWKAVSFVVEALYTLLVLVWYGTMAAAKFVARVTARTARLTARAMVSFGRWVRPRLKSFDSWLEIQVRRVEVAAGTRMKSHEAVRHVAAMGREYRKSLGDIHPKTVLRTAHQKAGAMKTRVLPPRGRSSQLKG